MAGPLITWPHYEAKPADADGLAMLREWFPEGEANELNFVLFSTSGVHGTYQTIEDAEKYVRGDSEDDDHGHGEVTFLIVCPRLVVLRWGNLEPKTPEDFAFLKKLRASSWAVVQKIGAHE